MYRLTFLFAASAIFSIIHCCLAEEKLQPVELAYSCIEAETDVEREAKTPILLLHGLFLKKEDWNSVNLLLASSTKRRVCAVDLRNHGDSPWDNRTDVEVLTADIGHFLDIHGINKVNLIGHSLGGKISMRYALKNPDRVDSIVVEDIRPNNPSAGHISQAIYVFQLLIAAEVSIPVESTEEEAKKSIGDFLNKNYEESGSNERLPDNFSEIFDLKLVDGKWRFKHNLKALLESFKNSETFWTKSTGLYNGPALFIYGTESSVKVNEYKDDILKLFPNAELVPVEGAGHVIHGVFRQFDDAVIRFLNKENS